MPPWPCPQTGAARPRCALPASPAHHAPPAPPGDRFAASTPISCVTASPIAAAARPPPRYPRTTSDLVAWDLGAPAFRAQFSVAAARGARAARGGGRTEPGPPGGVRAAGGQRVRAAKRRPGRPGRCRDDTAGRGRPAGRTVWLRAPGRTGPVGGGVVARRWGPADRRARSPGGERAAAGRRGVAGRRRRPGRPEGWTGRRRAPVRGLLVQAGGTNGSRRRRCGSASRPPADVVRADLARPCQAARAIAVRAVTRSARGPFLEEGAHRADLVQRGVRQPDRAEPLPGPATWAASAGVPGPLRGELAGSAS
jgi:hypothetical protein